MTKETAERLANITTEQRLSAVALIHSPKRPGVYGIRVSRSQFSLATEHGGVTFWTRREWLEWSTERRRELGKG